MRRREFITLLGSAASAWPLAARAQPAPRLPVVAFVHAVTWTDMVGSDPASPLARAFVHGLRDRGWVEGQTVSIERRSAEGQPQRAPAIFAELMTRGVDVIAMGGSHGCAKPRSRRRKPSRPSSYSTLIPLPKALCQALLDPAEILPG